MGSPELEDYDVCNRERLPARPASDLEMAAVGVPKLQVTSPHRNIVTALARKDLTVSHFEGRARAALHGLVVVLTEAAHLFPTPSRGCRL